MRFSDWSSDVCSSDLTPLASSKSPRLVLRYMMDRDSAEYRAICQTFPALPSLLLSSQYSPTTNGEVSFAMRSEEHASELQSLMRISYAVFCLKKKKEKDINHYIYS